MLTYAFFCVCVLFLFVCFLLFLIVCVCVLFFCSCFFFFFFFFFLFIYLFFLFFFMSVFPIDCSHILYYIMHGVYQHVNFLIFTEITTLHTPCLVYMVVRCWFS